MGTNESKLTAADYRSAAQKVRKALLEVGLEPQFESLAVLGIVHMEAEADRLEPTNLATQLAKAYIDALHRSGLTHNTWAYLPDSQRTEIRHGMQFVVAHLGATSRLIPPGGMALTAEQVEDVRTAREGLRGYRNFDGNARGRVNRLIAAVDALFPATEPAEPAASEGVNCGANSVVLGWCTLSAQHEGLHTNGTYFWGQAPAPAEPAEDETKAEVDGDFIEIVFDGPPEAVSGRFVEVENPQGASISVGEWIDRGDGFWALRIPYPSSPVAPAPTETGPWQRIEDVPEGVLQIKDRHGRTWLVVGGTWRFEWHDGNWYEPHTNINAQAPFVAAAEEG